MLSSFSVHLVSLFLMNLPDPEFLWKSVSGTIRQSFVLPHTCHALVESMLPAVICQTPPNQRLSPCIGHCHTCLDDLKVRTGHCKASALSRRLYLTGARWQLQSWAAVGCQLSTRQGSQHINTCKSSHAPISSQSLFLSKPVLSALNIAHAA